LTVEKASAEAARIAESPAAAISTCRHAPLQMPNSAAKPERMPLLIVWPRMKAISGPGDRLRRVAAVRKAIQCASE